MDSNLVCCCFCRASPIPTYPRLAGAGSTFGSVPPCSSLPLALHFASVILAVLTEATWKSSCALGRRDRTRILQGLTLTLRPLRWVIYSLLKSIKIASFSNCCSCHQPPLLTGTALTRGWLPRWPDINIPSRQGGFHPEGRGYLEHLAKTRRGSTS